jgi:hypothetical protein
MFPRIARLISLCAVVAAAAFVAPSGAHAAQASGLRYCTSMAYRHPTTRDVVTIRAWCYQFRYARCGLLPRAVWIAEQKIVALRDLSTCHRFLRDVA